MIVMDWIFSSLLTIAFVTIVVVSILQIVTTCRQWRQLARRYPLRARATPDQGHELRHALHIQAGLAKERPAPAVKSLSRHLYRAWDLMGTKSSPTGM